MKSMEKKPKNEKRLVDIAQLDKLRAMLPKHYYKDFSSEFNTKFIKTKQAKKVPSRMLVYLVMEGKSEDDAILETLIQIAQTRSELRKKLNETISSAHDHQQGTPATD